MNHLPMDETIPSFYTADEFIALLTNLHKGEDSVAGKIYCQIRYQHHRFWFIAKSYGSSDRVFTDEELVILRERYETMITLLDNLFAKGFKIHRFGLAVGNHVSGVTFGYHNPQGRVFLLNHLSQNTDRDMIPLAFLNDLKLLPAQHC